MNNASQYATRRQSTLDRLDAYLDRGYVHEGEPFTKNEKDRERIKRKLLSFVSASRTTRLTGSRSNANVIQRPTPLPNPQQRIGHENRSRINFKSFDHHSWFYGGLHLHLPLGMEPSGYSNTR